MKKILVLLALLFVTNANAQVTAADLMGLGMPSSLAEKVASIGTGSAVLTNNTYIKAYNAAGSATISVLKVDATDDTELASDASDLIKLRPSGDANRLFTFDAATDAAHTLKYGDGGTTATQSLTISSANADADDDSTTCIAGGGAAGETRGGYLCAYGDQTASTGLLDFHSGAGGGAAAQYSLSGAGVHSWYTNNGTLRWTISNAGDLLGDATSGGNITLRATGKTLGVDSGTAATACKGTVTATGTTAVTVSTTCAATGAIVYLQRTSAPSGTAQCWFDTIVNGTSFNLDCDGAETGTFAWWILKEG